MIADVMDLLDSTIANLAGPSIRADLGGSETTLQWVLAAYTVTFAIGLVTSGRLGDLLGRRRLFLAGMAGFTLASLACGLAPSATFLIIAGREHGWPAWCWLMIVGAVLALVLFVVSERRSRHPVITPSLFRRRSFVVGLVVTGAFFASFHRLPARLQPAAATRPGLEPAGHRARPDPLGARPHGRHRAGRCRPRGEVRS